MTLTRGGVIEINVKSFTLVHSVVQKFKVWEKWLIKLRLENAILK